MDAKEIGRFICSLRKDKGLTQSALAELLNISNRTVSKWETGEGLPDISLLPDLAKVLGVTTDEILAGKKAPAEKSADIKVEEVANKDNLLNLFKIAFVISLFFAIFGMLLGTITELYCIWAFNILFYTHWEIMFVAVSLVAVVAAGLVFSVGVTRLSVAFSKTEIIALCKKKGLWLSVISVIFPLSFIARIIELSRFGYYTLPIMLVIIAALVFAGVKLYGKIR
jgi:transcriptional regulator with XRE-family HTH domain